MDYTGFIINAVRACRGNVYIIREKVQSVCDICGEVLRVILIEISVQLAVLQESVPEGFQNFEYFELSVLEALYLQAGSLKSIGFHYHFLRLDKNLARRKQYFYRF